MFKIVGHPANVGSKASQRKQLQEKEPVSEEFDFDSLDRDMKSVIAALKKRLAGLPAARASVGLVDSLIVDYYGRPTPIKGFATVSLPEPGLITVKPWEKSGLNYIEKAIREANLGCQVTVDGLLVNVQVPIVSETRRKELVKSTIRYCEEGQVALRQIRRDALEIIGDLLKEKIISPEDKTRLEADVEKALSQSTKEIDAVRAAKEREILNV